jgi:cellulose synthase/poly-beta-1,6-N-acetylglucosamine synthase-like glycosyltransferase
VQVLVVRGAIRRKGSSLGLIYIFPYIYIYIYILKEHVEVEGRSHPSPYKVTSVALRY